MTDVVYRSVKLIWTDLDLEVEEEEISRGIEPPAYWPSREGSVVVDKLTCHYAPQVSLHLVSRLSSIPEARPRSPRCLLHYRSKGEDRYLR